MRRLLCAIAIVAGLAPPAGAQARYPSEGPPRPLSAHDVEFPAYEIRTLANGLQVVTVLHHEQPVVSIRMIVRSGSAADPKDKLGLSRLLSSLLDQGTTTQSANEFSDAIDFMGAEADAGAGTDLSFVNFIVMKDSFQTGLGMMSDMVRHPAFRPAEIERQRQQLLSNLEVSQEDPDFLASSVFDRLVYGFHPYGMPDSGTRETLKAISREDLTALHERVFVPNNAILAVVGDVSAEEAFAGVSRAFGDWPRRDVPKTTFIAPPDSTRRLVLVNKPDAVQTEVRIGQIGIRRNHPDYMAVNLAIRILGGEGANRLHQVLRTERGLTYGAEANMNALLEAGDFEAKTNTRSEATGEVVRLMVDEFWRLQRERVSEVELNDAKAYITGSFPLTIETPDAIATQVLNVLFYGLPIEELQTFRQRVNAVTPDDVQRVARQYLRPDRLSIALVGNATAFKSQLKGVGFGTFETVNMEELDLTSIDFKRTARQADRGPAGVDMDGRRRRLGYQAQPGGQLRSPIASSDQARARALLDRAIEAKGGLNALRAVKNLVATTQADRATPGGTVSAETKTYLEYPNHVRVETKVPGATLLQVFDGAAAWVRDPNGLHEVPDRMIHDLEVGLRRDTVALLVAARDGSVRARALADRKDAGGAALQALELSAPDLDPIVLLLDPSSGQIERQVYAAPGPGQAAIEEVFTDYRPVNGVQIAFTVTVMQGGQTMMTRRVVDLKLNQPLDSSLFKRPS